MKSSQLIQLAKLTPGQPLEVIFGKPFETDQNNNVIFPVGKPDTPDARKLEGVFEGYYKNHGVFVTISTGEGKDRKSIKFNLKDTLKMNESSVASEEKNSSSSAVMVAAGLTA